MFCHNCGAQVKDGAKFCTKCGICLTDENVSSQVNRVQVNVKQSQQLEQNSYAVKEDQRKKSHGFLWLLLILLIASIAFLYFSPYTRELYVYSDLDFYCSVPLPSDEEEIEELNRDNYKDCYLWQKDTVYQIINLETGVSTDKYKLEKEGGGLVDVKIGTQGSYAYVQERIILFDDVLTMELMYYFRRASLFERAYFVYKMFSLMSV